MAIFTNKSREEKKQEQIQRYKERYQLDELDEKDLQILEYITSDLIGNELGKAGMALSFKSMEEQMKVTYLSALVEQNWIIIRKLNEISKKLGEGK